MTAKVRITRKRLLPNQQVLDIRNALYYLQGEPNVDRARVGVWGAGMGGGHAIVIAATDARVKAVVAQTPIIEGKNAPKKAWAPTGELLQAEMSRARSLPQANGAAVAWTHETNLALAEYRPFWYLDQIPEKIAVLFVVAEKDTVVDNETNAIAASKLLKGPANVINIPKATHAGINVGPAFEQALGAAADWFLKHL
jgi:dienelactone hydrolase